MRLRDHGLLANLASLLLSSLLAGLVVAAAVFPVLALAGLAGKSGADSFEHLPSDFTVLPSPQTTNVFASDGQTMLASFYEENRRDIPIDDVSVNMQRAIVAAEDKDFYSHHGVDLKGILRAVVNNQRGDTSQQGGSTLTMQYVRQQALYSARTAEEALEATEKTNARKLREMKYAIELEKHMSKQQILEGYLNIASFGQGAWGIQAAAQVYFGKQPKDLTLAESALLASLPKAPSTYNLATPDGLQAALDRSRGYVLPNMVKMGVITPAQRDAAAEEVPKITVHRRPQGCTEVQHPELGAGFFCNYLLQWWTEQPDFGENQFQRENLLRTGGFTIVTSLDLNTQQLAFKYAQERAPMTKPMAVLLAAVEPGTGKVQALAANRVFSNDQTSNGENTNPVKRKAGIKGNYPNTTLPLITGSDAAPGYQSGSVFKMFTVAAALENGYPLSYTIRAQSRATTKYVIGAGDDAACPGTHFYCPVNANPSWMDGVRTMWSAFGRSVNTYFVPLQERVGAAKVVEMAKRLGIKFRSPSDAAFAAPDRSNQWGPFTLGVSATTPLDLANAWATIAADGKYCPPTPVQQILDRNGGEVKAGAACTQAIAPEIARGTVDVARCPVGDHSSTSKCDGGTAADMRGIIKHPVAGKTGSTDNDNIATLTVTTKQLAVSGFIVDPDSPNRPNVGDHKIVNQAVGSLLRDAMAGKPGQEFTPPPPSIVYGDQVSVPSTKCLDVEAAKRTLSKAGFQPVVSNQQVASECPTGRVAGTEPSGKSAKGSTVEILISKGGGAPAPGNGGPPGPNR